MCFHFKTLYIVCLENLLDFPSTQITEHKLPCSVYKYFDVTLWIKPLNNKFYSTGLTLRAPYKKGQIPGQNGMMQNNCFPIPTLVAPHPL